MKTIAVLNLKGGTAKTVTAATMARCLSTEHGRQVLLIDADQQGNLSQYFGVTDTSDSGLPVFRTLIRLSPPVPRSIAARESVLTFSPHCGASKDYRAFVREYLEGR